MQGAVGSPKTRTAVGTARWHGLDGVPNSMRHACFHPQPRQAQSASHAPPHLDVVLHIVRHTPQHQLAQACGPPKVQGPQQAAIAVVQGHHLAGGGQRHNLLAEAICKRGVWQMEKGGVR